MFPYEIIAGIDMYVIMLCIAAVSAIVVFRIAADKRGLGARIQNLCIYNAVISIILGYYSAVVFQALYNIPSRGKFVIDLNTGATFYGGLIGGASVFLGIYFIAGQFLFGKGGEHVRSIRTITDIGAAAIAIAHAFGRIGCLMAGCCHGAETDAWYGIFMPAIGKKVVPIQLFEAIMLFAIFAFLFIRVLKGKTYGLSIYMAVYGVWRFLIEYARTDYRGDTVVSFLTPSQLIAILMVAGAAVIWYFEYRSVKRIKNERKA